MLLFSLPSGIFGLSPPSPPHPPPVLIPFGGVAVLNGDAPGRTAFNSTSAILFCLYPGDEAITDPTQLGIGVPTPKSRIAGQCCTEAQECRRRPLPNGDENGNDACISDFSSPRGNPKGEIRPMTFGEVKTYCAGLGLGLCRQSCRGTGCQYDRHPVFTGVPCPYAAPPPSPPAAPPPPPHPPVPTNIPSHGIAILNGDAPDQPEGPPAGPSDRLGSATLGLTMARALPSLSFATRSLRAPLPLAGRREHHGPHQPQAALLCRPSEDQPQHQAHAHRGAVLYQPRVRRALHRLPPPSR